MHKILDLTEKEFLTSIAPSSQVQDKGLWSSALGIDPIHSHTFGNESTGLLQAGPAATDLTGSDIVDVPWAWATDVSTTSTEDLYVWGDSGNLYKIPLSSDSPTISSYSTGLSAAAGLFVMTHATGGTWPYVFTTTGIYQADMATPTLTSQTTALESTKWHPTHRLFDRVYFGNGRYIGSCEDEGSSAALTVTTNVLDFPAEYRVNCLSDDGSYLVAEITTVISTDTLAHGHSKIIFWDTNQDSWQREWVIPDAAILSIRRVGTTMEAVTTRGVYAFTFNSPPRQMLPYLSSGDAPSYAYPTHAAADVIGEALLWGGSGHISMFGAPIPNVPAGIRQPYAGLSGSVTMVAASAKTGKVYVGTSNSKLYLITVGGTTRQTGVSAETIFIDLARWWQVGRIALEFDGQLASSDDIDVDVQPDSATSASDWGAATYAANGAIRTKELYGSIEARKLKLVVNFNGGVVKIRAIAVYGDPIETPTHA